MKYPVTNITVELIKKYFDRHLYIRLFFNQKQLFEPIDHFTDGSFEFVSTHHYDDQIM